MNFLERIEEEVRERRLPVTCAWNKLCLELKADGWGTLNPSEKGFATTVAGVRFVVESRGSEVVMIDAFKGMGECSSLIDTVDVDIEDVREFVRDRLIHYDLLPDDDDQ